MNKANKMYLSEISKIPLLSLEEEKALATKAHSGDKSAQKKLVEANLRFVVKIANKYKDYMDIDDLITEGNLGLMRAVEKFNPKNDNKFSTYAVWWIRSFMQKAIREVATGIRFPATRFEDMKLGKWKIASLDKVIPGKDENEVTFGSLLSDDKNLNPEDAFWENQKRQIINEMIDSLDEKQRTVMIKRYGLDGNKPMSLSEIGTLMGYSKERIRQIESKAVKTIKLNMACMDYATENNSLAA